jgi:hypothetical protein
MTGLTRYEGGISHGLAGVGILYFTCMMCYDLVFRDIFYKNSRKGSS